MTVATIEPFYSEPINTSLESFQAEWTEELLNLTPKATSTLDKIVEFIKDFIFYIPKLLLSPLITTLIIPMSSKWFFPSGFLLASGFLKEMNRCFYQTWNMKQLALSYLDLNTWLNRLFHRSEALKFYDALELKIKTPDNLELSGHFFKHKNFDQPNARIMLVFGGNGEFYKTGSTLTWLMKDLYNLEDVPVSFLTVNLRGCENSEGYPTRDGLIIDAESLYQFAKKQLDGDESRIDLFGHSLGGTIAFQLKHLHPQTGGLSFISRTFNNLLNESEFYAQKEFGTGFIAQTCYKVIRYIAELLHWQYDNECISDKIEDTTYVFYHQIDETIPYENNIASSIKNKGLDQRNYHLLEMKDDELAFINNVNLPHMMTLDQLEVVNRPGQRGLDVIVEALKSKKKLYR